MTGVAGDPIPGGAGFRLHWRFGVAFEVRMS